MTKFIFFAIFSAYFALLDPGLSCDPDVGRQLDEDRIINGDLSSKGTWPFIVRFGKKENKNEYSNHLHTCAGTYIGNGWVISSAHCFRKNRYSPIYPVNRINTYFGDFYWHAEEVDDEAFTLKPIEAIAHDVADLVLLKYDLSKINKQINSGGGASYVREACIPNVHVPQGASFSCYIAGWGLTEAKNYNSVSNELLEAEVHIMSENYVRQKTGYTPGPGYFAQVPNSLEVDYPREFCAGPLDLNNNGKTDADQDSCSGDSGGPLICAVDGKPILVGVVARGKSCGLERYPGIYVSVAEYSTWIHQNTGNAIPIMKIDHLLSGTFPNTPKPQTESPITESPVTESPVTESPITESPTTDLLTTSQPVTEPISEQNLSIGNDIFGTIGEDMDASVLQSILIGRISSSLTFLYPKWNAAKLEKQGKRLKLYYSKLFTTCSKKAQRKPWSCGATGTEAMRIPDRLDHLGDLRFFMIDVATLITDQWYKDADQRTVEKGFKQLIKLIGLTNKLLHFPMMG